MEKEFIPYEQSLELKELGFDEDCFGCYAEKKEVIVRVGDYRSFQNNDSEDVIIRDFNSYENGTVSAPLYQQVFRWFRDKYGLIGQPIPLSTSYPGKVTHYGWSIVSNQNANDWENEDDGFKTYEEAELECLKKLIEIVKER
jgi:hypothetical protein